MTRYDLHLDGSNQDTRQAKIMRAVLGASYGFLAGLCFAYVSVNINTWLHRDLPLGVDGQLLWTRLPLFALGLALVGAVTCWWNDIWPGLLSGAATAAALTLIATLFSSDTITMGMKVIVLIFILVPFAAIILPIAWLLRWVMEKHIDALKLNSSLLRISGLFLVILLLAAAGGYFTKMNAGQLEATRYLHTLLQNPNTENSDRNKIQGIAEHQGVPYKLYSTKSATSNSGYDVRADFADGYVVQCTVVLYPGYPLYISACSAPIGK